MRVCSPRGFIAKAVVRVSFLVYCATAWVDLSRQQWCQICECVYICMRRKVDFVVMADNRCYICLQEQPCCGQGLHLFPCHRDNHTDERWKNEDPEIVKKVEELWENNQVWQVCNGHFYRQLRDPETWEMTTVLLAH